SAAGGGPGQTARLWDVPSEEALGHPLLQSGQIRTLAFSPDGQLLLTGTEDKSIRVWNLTTGRLLDTLPPRKGRLDHIFFSPDGQSFMTIDNDTTGGGHISLWDRSTYRLRLEHIGRYWVDVATFTPDGKSILIAHRDIGLQLWNLSTDQCTDT